MSALLVAMVGAAGGLYLESALGRSLDASVEAEFERLALGIRATLARGIPGRADDVADEIGAATQTRVTLIDSTGRVVGDSDVERDEIAALEPHGTRPEVLAARRDGVGIARRRSQTLATDLLYVAVPIEGGFLRVSTPLARVDEGIARVRELVVVAGVIGLALALLMSFFAAQLLSRRLHTVLDAARVVAEIAGTPLPAREDGDEIGRLASSFEQLGGALQSVVTQLADERDRFATVLDAMREAVVAVDGETRVHLANRAGRKLLGLEGEAEGRVCELVAHPGLQTLLTIPGAPVREIELADGRHLLGHVTADPHGAGAVFVVHDVTRLRQLERIRRDFVANVSHELRTPVTVVLANAETLLDGALDDPERARIFVGAIMRHAQRLTDLISDLLDIARIESGNYAIEPARVLVEQAARSAAETVRDRAGGALEVGFDLSGLAVRADAQALEQILVNLLENAQKYGGEQVHVSAKPCASGVRGEIRDEGPGIPEAHRDRIFERFYRIDGGRSKATGGTGLGLSIVKNLVLAMDGQVGVAGHEDGGAVFWIELPRA